MLRAPDASVKTAPRVKMEDRIAEAMDRAVHIDKNATAIRDMFARVAPRYDLLNGVLSVSLDRLWRRQVAKAVTREAPPGAVLDLCCGTGDQALSISRRRAPVVAADFCLPMLHRARGKFAASPGAPMAVAADALVLPFAPGSFAAVTVAFGVRNVANLDSALTQMLATLRPEGVIVILEFALPRPALLRQAYLFYFRYLMPAIARLLGGRGAAYRYLRDSVLEFQQRDALTESLRQAGFVRATWQDLSAGTVCMYMAKKPTAA